MTRVQVVRSFPVAAAGGGNGDIDVTFSSTENPISYSGKFKNGATDGRDWIDFRSANGRAYSAATVSDTAGHYNDAAANLSGARSFTSNQEVVIYVHLTNGYNPSGSGINHELEAHVRQTISNGLIKTYEFGFNIGNNSGFLMRWDGVVDNAITPITATYNVSFTIVHGSIIRFRAVGDVLSGYHTPPGDVESLVIQGTDSSAGKLTSGAPGMGSFPRTGSTLDGFGVTRIIGRDV